jgi:hypothetical protein
MNEDVKAVLREIRNTTGGNGYVSLTPILPSLTTGIKTAFGAACQLAGIENLHWQDQHRNSTIGTAPRHSHS